MRWATLYYRNRYLLWLTVVLTLLTGGLATLSLPITEDPIITNRGPLVITAVPGASAERVEALVTTVIEEKLREIPEIKEVGSTSRAGISTVGIELLDSIGPGENKRIFSQIRDKLADAELELPAEAAAPVLEDQRNAVAYTILLGVTWTGPGEPNMAILGRHARALAEELRNVGGTMVVDVFGEPQEELRVVADPAELATAGLNAGDLARLIRAADAKVPAGVFRGGGSQTTLEVDGALDTIARVASIPLVRTQDGATLRVGDVAVVSKAAADPPEQIALTGGRRTVLVGAKMERGGRIGTWMNQADQVVEAYRPRIGGGVELDVLFDQSEYTTDRLTELVVNLLLGAGVVVAVIFVLMGWRNAFVVGSALPLVSGAVLAALLLIGGELHQMSVFGMIIALGLLIDNAIVVTDEVGKRLAEGQGRYEAVGGTVKTLAGPLLASTLTTILGFLPIMLLPGGGGDFVGGIALSVVLAVAASFVIALTIIVSLAGTFAAPRTQSRLPWWRRSLRQGVDGGAITSVYRRGLGLALQFPVIACLIAMTPPAAGLVVAGGMGSAFFPPTDRDMFDVRVWLGDRASVEQTREVVERVSARIEADPDVERVDWLVGASFPSVYYNLVMNQDGRASYAQGVVRTTDAVATDRLVRELQVDLYDALPEARVVVKEFNQGPPVLADVQYRIIGPDLDVLREIGDRYRLALQAHPDVVHAQATLTAPAPKLWLDADPDQVEQAGLRLTDLAAQLQAALDGVVGGSLLDGPEELPVRVRLTDAVRSDLTAVASMRFTEPTDGTVIPLAALGELTLRPAEVAIPRDKGIRVNTIEAYTRPDALAIDVAREVLDRVEAQGQAVPAGYRIELGGEAETSGESEGNLAAYLPAIAAAMLATLVLAFRSLRMAAMLLVIAGACVGLGLLSTFSIGYPFGFNTILGTLGLIGVGLNDSIVVIAAIRNNPAARAGDADAVVDEVMGCTRHVLSTTLTTVGGFAPLLLLTDGQFYPSLAVVLAGGILGATLLSLVFIPAAYTLLHPRRFGLLGSLPSSAAS
jgi:multidrug efflux pump subunit AcrB